MFLTIPASDSERLDTVAWLGAHGISCYLRLRVAANDPENTGTGDSITILVPEEQLQQAKQVLAAMPVNDESS